MMISMLGRVKKDGLLRMIMYYLKLSLLVTFLIVYLLFSSSSYDSHLFQ